MKKTAEKKKSYLWDWHWCVEKPAGLDDFLKSLVYDQTMLEETGKNIWASNKKSVEVCTYKSADGEEIPIALKRSNDRRFMRYLFRPSQALREYRGFQIVKSFGSIPCVEVLACGDLRSFCSLKQSYFVTRYVEDTYQLREYEKGRSRDKDHAELYGLLRKILSHLAVMHKAGFRHGGAHGRNFLCKKNSDGKVDVHWIDLVNVRKISLRNKRRELLVDLCDLIEFFEFSDEELTSLQDLYCSITGNAVRFEKIASPKKKLNRCVWAR